MDKNVRIMNFKNNGLSYVKTSHSNSDLNIHYVSRGLLSIKYFDLEIGKTYIIFNNSLQHREAVLIEINNAPSQSVDYVYKYTKTEKGEAANVSFNVPVYKISGGYPSEASIYKYVAYDTMTSIFYIRNIKAKKNAFELYINDIGNISSSR